MDVLKKTWQYFKPYKIPLIITLLMGLVITALNMVNPYVTKLIFDRVINRNERNLLLPLLLAMLFQTLIRHSIQYFRSYMIESISQKVIIKIRSDAFKKFLSMNFNFFNKEKTGNTMTIMTGDADMVNGLISSTIPAIIEMTVSFIFANIILFSLNAWMTLGCYLILPLTFFLTKKYSKCMRPMYADVREQSAQLSTVAQENINGVRVVRAFCREDYESQKFDLENNGFTQKNIALVKTSRKLNWKLSFASNFPYVFVILLGGILVMKGNITIGTFIAFSGYIQYIMNPINSISGYITSIQNAIASGEKLFSFLDRGAQIESPENAVKLNNFTGNIEFRNVYLSYDGKKVLKDINLNAPLGSKIGIIGETGSGKTSLVNLIGRFYDCSRGTVLIDGIDVKMMDLKSLRQKIAYVMQDVFLFSDSVESNIVFNNPDAPFEDVVAAAKAARAHDFIIKMPEGYDTIIGERGIGLSGGQKQRISIARAILKNAPIIILDDSTSSLDMETEHEIQEELKALFANKTQIIIAHRISAVMDADEIIFIKDGSIVERGTHEELLKINGHYAGVFYEQYSEHKNERTAELNLGSAVREICEVREVCEVCEVREDCEAKEAI